MFNANYHTHTYRCGHAIGKDEEYVQEALGLGLQELGFSDHAMYPDFDEENIRGSFSQNQGYFDSVNALKAKYDGRLKIYLGYEAEYFDPYVHYLKSLLVTHQIDYLLLGNHSAMNEDHRIYARFGKPNPNAQNIWLYVKTACAALKSGMYSCFGHPDLFLAEVENFDLDCRKASIQLIQTAMECDVPLEINVAGIRSGKSRIGKDIRWHYPTEFFFRFAQKMKAPCIIGLDAHAPSQMADPLANQEAIKFARRLNLQVIDRLKIKKVSV